MPSSRKSPPPSKAEGQQTPERARRIPPQAVTPPHSPAGMFPGLADKHEPETLPGGRGPRGGALPGIVIRPYTLGEFGGQPPSTTDRGRPQDPDFIERTKATVRRSARAAGLVRDDASDDEVYRAVRDELHSRREWPHDMIDGTSLAHVPMLLTRTTTPRAPATSLPPLDRKSPDWIRARDVLKIEAAETEHTLKEARARGTTSKDRTFGYDAANRAWRKNTAKSNLVFYYRPSLHPQ